MDICYLTPDRVIEINKQQIELYTPLEPHGLISRGALESALMRGQWTHHYKPDSDIFSIVASIGFSINKAHAFINANKRTATNVTFVTLVMNGYLPRFNDEEIVEHAVMIANNLLTEEKYAEALRNNSIRLDIDNTLTTFVKART